MLKQVSTDIAIIGGGISGLWLLNRLRSLGFSAILLETNQLGGGQTHKSQGILHSGIKYILQGHLTKSARAISAMPSIWEDCLNGHGDINLSAVPVLTKEHFLWSSDTLSSKFTGFLARMALASNVKSLAPCAYPNIFQHPTFTGQVYSVQEWVIDIHALIRELATPHQDVIFKIDAMHQSDINMIEENVNALTIHQGDMNTVNIKAKQ